VCFGEEGEKLSSLLSPFVRCVRCPDLESAVELASREAVSGETVLLSPSCASFDQFRSFEHRGDEFRRLVWLLR